MKTEIYEGQIIVDKKHYEELERIAKQFLSASEFPKRKEKITDMGGECIKEMNLYIDNYNSGIEICRPLFAKLKLENEGLKKKLEKRK